MDPSGLHGPIWTAWTHPDPSRPIAPPPPDARACRRVAHGAGGGGQLAVRKSDSFRDVVLWNLGEAKAPSMADLGAGEWRHYVCLEAGAIGEPVALGPGAAWKGSQEFVCEPSAAACEQP